MKPAPFDYLAPHSLEEALELIAEHGGDGKILAGGQSLIPLLNFRLAQPALLIDLNRLPTLDFIRQGDDGGLRIGAMTRQRRVESDPLVAATAPLVAETLPWVAHSQIRNRGTFGGNLAHADPASELPAVALTLGMRFKLRSRSGERWVSAADFFVSLLTTDMAADEMLVEIDIPPLPPRTGWSFMEIARRHGDYAQIGVAAQLTLGDDGRCQDARLAYLSCGDTPMLAQRAADQLIGGRLETEAIETAAATAAEEEIDPCDDIHASAAFKRRLARTLTRRALAVAHERAGGGGPGQGMMGQERVGQ